ncbi:hypothetical protein AVEN_185013-1 [Araneus ventricosus]|uniref:Uncharacterized protein n=1 Tax=Araneus ventricosus TaxID=182803 RepID=A0A4Y2BQR3_ARAVE|nr:hypothetical protein AVEN_185013-1 [Araneus ventricosus]
MMSWPKRQSRPRRQQCSRYQPPLPRSSAKQDIKQRALAKWQRFWDDDINGRSTYEVTKKVRLRNHYWQRQLIQFITEHGSSHLIFSDLENTRTTAVPVENLARLFTIPSKYHLTLSYHLMCPADQHIEACMKSITIHRLLTNKIIDPLNFITSKKTYLNRNSQNNSTIACIVHPTTNLMSPTTPPPLSWNILCQRQTISFSVLGSSHIFTTRLTYHQRHHVKVHLIILGRRI